MGYDYFSQLQGPVVQTSLFPDSYNKGVAAGEAVPSKLTSIARGITSGIKTSIDIVGGIENNILKANEISQIPVDNQIKQEQLENAQITNDINSIKRDISTETKVEQLSATKETLLNTAEELSKKRALREKETSLQEQLASADPLTQKKIINSGQFNDVFAANPNVYRQAISGIYPYLSPEEQHAAEFNLKRSSTSLQYDREAEKHRQAFSNARNGVLSDSAIIEAARNSKLTPEDVVQRGRYEPSGKYEKDDSGNILIDDKTKQPKISPSYDPSVAPHTYDIVIGDPKTGRSRIVAEGATAESKKLKNSYINEQSWIDGTYKQRALTRINEEALESDPSRKQTEVESVVAPTVSNKVEQTTVSPNSQAVAQIQSVPVVDKSRNINVGSNPVAINNIASMLGIPPSVGPEATPRIQEFLKLTEEAPEGYFGRFSEEQIAKKEATINSLAIFTAKKEFELNDMEKAGYNEEAVKQHNKLVKEVLKNRFSDKIKSDSSETVFSSVPSGMSISDLVVVATPKDLYALKRKGYFQSQLQLAYKKYRDKIELTKQALLKAGTRGSRLAEVLNQAG